jgi:hypothetical protein
MRNRVVASAIVIGLLTAGAACMQRRPQSRAKDMDAGHDKARWLAKVVRILHYRRDLVEVPNYQDLLNMPRAEAVDALMADPLFGDSVLDFGLYFLGFQQPTIRGVSGEGYATDHFSVGGFPQAIHAAQAVVSGGDFLTLFDRRQPRYLGQSEFTPDKRGLADGISDADARGERLKRAAENLKQAIDILASATSVAACAPFTEARTKFQDELQESGWNVLNIDFDANLDILGCDFPSGPLDFAAAKAKYDIKYSWLLELQQHREEWIALMRPAKNVMEFQNLDLFHVPGAPDQEAFSFKFYLAKVNSSTNANRRRAAYTLNTFFCDDLTPLNVALPAAHAGQGAHASDPACQACHYKLDPMAGFFRSRGFAGADFSAIPYFLFDDQKVIYGDALAKYMDSWKEPLPELAATRPWRVGYVRSPDMTSSKNTWGESYDDLFKIIRDAPEVRQCLTRRMAEYYVGNNLVYDGAWLRQLGSKFDNAQGPATSAAFKAIVKDLVLSKTFTMDNPSPDQCYDFPNGGQAPTLPCKVADIITRNCAGCHASVNGSGHVNLKNWTQGPDGVFSFEHNGADGQRLAKSISLARIIERLSTPDKTKLMPLMRSMPDVERAALYKWVNDESRSGH